MQILKADNVSKSYGQVNALSNFSIEIHSGEIIALLGPNGAGKTTFVKSVLGLLNIDSGEISLFENQSRTAKGRKDLAYLPEKFTFYDYFSVKAAMEFYADMREVSKKDLLNEINHALELVNASELISKKIKELSKGQLQRVGIACALLGSPNFLIFDEPFSGLDPIGIKEVKDLCRSLKEQGKTVLINSHILSEMELIADKVIILDKGEIRAYGSIADVCAGSSLEDRFYELVKGGHNAL